MMTRRGYGRGEHLDIKALWGQEATEQGRLIDPAESDTRTLSAERIGFIPQGVAGYGQRGMLGVN